MARKKVDMGYKLPKELYFETIWYIRSYPRLKEEADDIINASHAGDGQPSGGSIGDPTAQKADKYAEKMKQIRPIERGLKMIPEEYQQQVFNHVVYRRLPELPANHKTYEKWRQRFVYWVAMYRYEEIIKNKSGVFFEK